MASLRSVNILLTACSFSCHDIIKGFWLSYKTMPWCYNQVLSSYKNLLCNATFFSIFPQLPHGTMKSLKVPHPIYTKTSPLIGINVSEKKLSLPELDSWLSIDAAIIRHSLWFKALDHNPCEQISRAWQCPGSSVSWLDPASKPAPNCKCHCDVTCALQFSFQSRVWSVSPHVFIGLLVHNVISGESYVPIEFVYTAMKLLQIGVKIG